MVPEEVTQARPQSRYPGSRAISVTLGVGIMTGLFFGDSDEKRVSTVEYTNW